MASPNQNVSRQWRILETLERHGDAGASILELSRELSLTPRAIKKDLSELMRHGFPVVQSGSKAMPLWRLELPMGGLSSVKLTLTEIMALYASTLLNAGVTDDCFFRVIQRAFSKLRANLPTQSDGFLTELEGVAHPGFEGERPRADIKALLDPLTTCVSERRECMITRKTEAGESEEIIHPMDLRPIAGKILLLAYSVTLRRYETIPIQSLERVEPLSETFDVDPSFSADLQMRRSFRAPEAETTLVQLIVSKDAAAAVEKDRFNGTQRVTPLPLGELLVSLEAELSPQLIRWILSFGPLVRVIEPPALERRMGALVHDLMDLYPVRSANSRS